jgi:hypothetical protein
MIASTLEVTDLAHGPIARAIFEIPKGFVITTVPPVTSTSAAAESLAHARAARVAKMAAAAVMTLCDVPQGHR